MQKGVLQSYLCNGNQDLKMFIIIIIIIIVIIIVIIITIIITIIYLLMVIILLIYLLFTVLKSCYDKQVNKSHSLWNSLLDVMGKELKL